MVPDELIDEVAGLFALLSDPSRLRLVRALHEHGELPVGEIAARAGTTVANASQHLLRLSAAGVLVRRRAGKSVVYRVADPRIEQLCATVCASVRARSEILPMPAAAGSARIAGSREGR
ncbi:MAG TPA: metalloregulator ArsR/SmtB family transcription factor [Gaiellaceae bacterium]|nr:metalloregulator ArsR/SmtB family transcription factor [Gaiellaceae bacterium]